MLPPLQRDLARLRHMRDAAFKAVAYTRGHPRSILDSDEMRTLAVVRLVEIVGEAARAVSDATRQRYPTVAWRHMVGTRDRLIHKFCFFNFGYQSFTTLRRASA